MHPIIKFSLAGYDLALRSYSVFMLAAAVMVIAIGCLTAIRRGLPAEKTLVWAALTAAVMLPGARGMYLMTHLSVFHDRPDLLWTIQPAYFSIYGGLILAVLAGGLTCWLLKLPLWRLADSFTVGIGLGIATMRIGCFLNGCCFGRTTQLPWGVSFPTGSLPHSYQLALDQKVPLFLGLPLAGSSPVHPTQLYELAAALIGVLLAIYILQRREGEGVAFLAFVTWFTAFRFLDHYLRAPSLQFTSSAFFYPLLYSMIIAISILLVVFIKYRKLSISKSERR